MKIHRYQKGTSLYNIIFIILVAVMAAHTGFKLFPVYMEDWSIQAAIEGATKDPDVQYNRPSDVQQAILRRFGVNNVTRASRENVSVVRDGDYYRINVEYEVSLPYMANISLVLDFAHEAEVRAR